MNPRLVTFRLGNEGFGMAIRKVREITRMTGIARIPNAPDYVEGAVNSRGGIIPIVSLRTKLGLSRAECDRSPGMTVAEAEGRIAGFIVGSHRMPTLLDLEALSGDVPAQSRQPDRAVLQ